MYSAVYKCVCKQYGDRLYQDLINHVRTKMAEWSRTLSQVSSSSWQPPGILEDTIWYLSIGIIVADIFFVKSRAAFTCKLCGCVDFYLRCKNPYL